MRQEIAKDAVNRHKKDMYGTTPCHKKCPKSPKITLSGLAARHGAFKTISMINRRHHPRKRAL
jgi:hypothetical protein